MIIIKMIIINIKKIEILFILNIYILLKTIIKMCSTYGLFNTPLLTNHGMITGITIDGQYKFMPTPVINMNDFFQPKYNYVQEKKYNIDEYYTNLAGQNIKKEIKYNETDLIKVKLEAMEQQKKLLEIQFENEKKKNEQLEQKLENEKRERMNEEKEKTKLTTQKLDEFNKIMRNIAFKNFKNSSSSRSSRSSVSSFSLPSSTHSCISSHVSSVDYPDSVNTSMSDVQALINEEYDINFDDSVSQISDITITPIDDIDRLNGKSKISDCKKCDSCYNGVVSVGTIFVNSKDDDYNFVLGFNKYEDYYCDFGQKLKSVGSKMELPITRAQKALKRMTNIKYDLDGNDFIDIPIKDTKHVHRVYIIKVNNIDLNEFKISDEITEYSVFSFKQMDQNYDDFKNRNILNNSNKMCKINKRTQKLFNIFYDINIE